MWNVEGTRHAHQGIVVGSKVISSSLISCTPSLDSPISSFSIWRKKGLGWAGAGLGLGLSPPEIHAVKAWSPDHSAVKRKQGLRGSGSQPNYAETV